VARLVADRLGLALVDTGAIYRCVALQAGRDGIELTDVERLGALAARIQIELRRGDGQGGPPRVHCNGADVTDAIRSPEVSRAASVVSARPAVREALLALQRRLGRTAPAGAVLEGRDIGTVVFPTAEVKIFLTASPEERARRRFEELAAKGLSTTYEAVLSDQIARDREDENRPVAPLKPAVDAIRVDTTGLSTEAVVDRIVTIAIERQKVAHAETTPG